ncbi:unnamed protein product [Paramecium octaurelia]|uniref:Uncharacterized protein n=1 Tax=Paramecium octaurelia TaxID=43137 RepID=A0A8S1W108_PAROT|nr:unnamed protein product [Paramecium octaurelia]
MGNSHKKSDYGVIAILTEKPFYFAGDLVRGEQSFVIQVIKEISLNLQFKGKRQPSGRREVVRNKELIKGQINSILNHLNWIVYFSFPILIASKSSWIILPQKSIRLWLDMIKSESKIYIYITKQTKYYKQIGIHGQRPIKQDVVGQQLESTTNLTTCCCKNQGSSRVKSFCKTNHYLPGDTAQIIIEVDNSNCYLNIDYFQIELHWPYFI